VSAWEAAGEPRSRGGVLAAAARAAAWLVEPGPERTAAPVPALPQRPVVAVVGLGRRCGTTTVARALAVAFATRDPAGVAVVGGRVRAGPPLLAVAAARRLSRELAARGDDGVAAVGRLSVVDAGGDVLRHAARERPAPVVIDVPHGTPPESAGALADVLVLVSSGGVEPALSEVARLSLARAGREPLLVLNRPLRGRGELGAAFDVILPGAQLGARLALAGRESRGAFAEPVAELAGLCAGPI
jgi:hypothetical protein